MDGRGRGGEAGRNGSTDTILAATFAGGFLFALTIEIERGDMAEVRLSFRALIYKEDDWWIAHCLETDVVAEGKTPTNAFENLQSLTAHQIETALEEGDLQSIFHQAPSEICAAFAIGYEREIRRRLPKHIERFEVRDFQPA